MTPEIVKVIRDHAIEVTRTDTGYQCICPFHDTDRGPETRPTLQINKSVFGWFFKCWACGAHGHDDHDWKSWYPKEAKDGQPAPK